jgi:alkylation response protein AidB-like acyl-CoA dehydrogenase
VIPSASSRSPAVRALTTNQAQKSTILPQIAAGGMILAFAHGERQAR